MRLTFLPQSFFHILNSKKEVPAKIIREAPLITAIGYYCQQYRYRTLSLKSKNSITKVPPKRILSPPLTSPP